MLQIGYEMNRPYSQIIDINLRVGLVSRRKHGRIVRSSATYDTTVRTFNLEAIFV